VECAQVQQFPEASYPPARPETGSIGPYPLPIELQSKMDVEGPLLPLIVFPHRGVEVSMDLILFRLAFNQLHGITLRVPSE